MTKDLSGKFKLISLICTIMVVYRHAHTMQAFGGNIYNNWYLYSFIGHGFTYITSIAVPYFFLISGFFFFKQSYYIRNNYKKMLIKKVKTLFIPFIIWNIIAFFPLWIYGMTDIETWWVFIVKLLHSDFNGPLWYVRTLMLLMFLSPLYDWIFLLDRYVGKKIEIIVQIVVITYIIYIWWPMDSKVFSTEGWLFFLLGGMLRKNVTVLEVKINKICSVLLYSCWIITCFLMVQNYWVNKLHLLLGVFLFWHIIGKESKGWVTSLSGYTFFIYVNHFILLKVLKTILAYYFYGNECVALFTFLLSPLFVIIIIWKIGQMWYRISSNSFNFVTGGRS